MEVLVAMALLCVAALGGLQLVAVGTEMMARARIQSVAATLASARMEQLRGLRFEFDDTRLRLTDIVTDLAADPPGGGGLGLSPYGSVSLDTNVPGYADFADGNGAVLGGGTTPPTGAVFVRRWSVDALGATGDLVALQVLVRPLAAGMPWAGGRAAGDVRLVTLRARMLR